MPRIADTPYFNFRPGYSEEWREGAACGPIQTKLPWTATGKENRHAMAVGKAICNDICAVRPQCLAYALDAQIRYGTWGGMMEEERRKLPEEEKLLLIHEGRMTRYDVAGHQRKEPQMVLVVAKVKFAPGLRPGEMGEVEDNLARSAVRNGYASLVGNVLNYEGWMYHGEELQISQKKATPNPKSEPEQKPAAKKAPAKRAAAKRPGAKMVAQTETDGGE